MLTFESTPVLGADGIIEKLAVWPCCSKGLEGYRLADWLHRASHSRRSSIV